MQLSVLAIVAATVAAFVVSNVYYIALGGQLAAAGSAAAGAERPPAWKMLVELVRSAVLATVVAVLARGLGIADLSGALALGIGLWIGFPAVLLSGSVLWENVAPRLAALHAGDWLVKLLVVTGLVAVWR